MVRLQAPSAVPTDSPNIGRWAILGLGIVALSTASILIRLADAPPLVVGAWRMVLATVLITPWALPRARREWAGLRRRELALLVLAGVVLAAHFATWITSLSYTTVASSVILVTTNPIYVGLASHFVLKERVSRRMALAIVVALAGSAIVSYGDLALSGQALLGDLLALAGALCASAYLLIGRVLRRKLSTLAYIWPCYGLAGVLLAGLALVAGQPLTGYSAPTYGVLVLLAVFPQLLGHSSFNWALGHFRPVTVTLAILGEPVGATLLALLLLAEVPAPTALIGAALILLGIYVASREEQADRPSQTVG
ncbi:MAG: DMT family transporter [Anaerolineae bacterium]